MHVEDEHARVAVALQDVLQRLDAAGTRQRDVHHHHIRRQFDVAPIDLFAGAGLGCNGQRRMPLDQSPVTFAYYRVVVARRRSFQLDDDRSRAPARPTWAPACRDRRSARTRPARPAAARARCRAAIPSCCRPCAAPSDRWRARGRLRLRHADRRRHPDTCHEKRRHGRLPPGTDLSWLPTAHALIVLIARFRPEARGLR